MNDAQWLWCYMNVNKDEEEEEKKWKSRLDYLGWYIDPEKAIDVIEREEQEEEVVKTKKHQESGAIKSTSFDDEFRAAELGYDPESGLSIEEFLNQHESKVDINNSSFDDLVKSGQFRSVGDSNYTGNKETKDDFLSRAMDMRDYVDYKFNEQQTENDDEIKIDEADEMLFNQLLDKDQIENDEEYDYKKTQEILKQYGMTEDDLDIIETPNIRGEED